MPNTNGHGSRVALYIRVSTDEQAERGYSIPEQEQELLSHAEREGWYVVDTVIDDGYSGSVGTRPGLDKVTRMAEAGEIDVVLAKKRNRLFRDRYIRLGYERSLREYGVRLISLDDTNNRLADAVLDEFSDWNREELSRNTVAGRMQKAREGKLIASHTPIYGFEYTEDRNGYVVVPEKMAVVERVIRSVAKGTPLHAIKRELERSGIPAPGGGRIWSVKTLRDMVWEDAYLGTVYYPRRKVTQLEPDPTRGYRRAQRTQMYTREEQIAIPVVPSGIPSEVIEEARDRIAQNRPTRSAGLRVYELAGIARCAYCRNRLATNHKRSGASHYFYYRCARYQRDGKAGCEMNRSYRAERLEKAVLRAVLDVVKDKDELIRRAEEDFEDRKRELMRVGPDFISDWKRDVERMERERLEYFRQRARDALTDEELDSLLKELDEEMERTQQLMVQQEKREERIKELEKVRDKTIEMIEEGKWQQLGITAPERRRERYRDIGLQALVDKLGKIELSWSMGTKTVRL
jgi:site-specific DNA recombinase